MVQPKFKYYLKILFFLGGVTLLIFPIPRIIVWYDSWYPIYDFGPFTGVRRDRIPDHKPDQIKNIYNKYQVVVFDPDSSEQAPTVLLKDSNGRIKWCIYAHAFGETTVKKIRFDGEMSPLFFEPRLRGIVTWSLGIRQKTLWYITKEGNLSKYWYSD